MLARAALIIVGVAIGLAGVALTRPGMQGQPGGVVTLTGPGLDEAYITLYRPAPATYGVFARTGSGWVRIDTIARGASAIVTPRLVGVASMLSVGPSPGHPRLVATSLEAVRRDGIGVGFVLDRVQLLAPSCDPRVPAIARQALPYLGRLASPAARTATQALRRLIRAVRTGHCQAVSGALAALAEATPTLAQIPLISP